MAYRAKITDIQEWIGEQYDLNDYTTVRDDKHVYIEVEEEEEAEEIEAINAAQELVNYKKTILELKLMVNRIF